VRGHPFKLYKGFELHTLFSVKGWNRLPDSVDFTSLLCFKRSLDTADFSVVS